MAEFKKIIIAEDHRLFREGLKALLSDNQELDVSGEAGDGLERDTRIKQLPRCCRVLLQKGILKRLPVSCGFLL